MARDIPFVPRFYIDELQYMRALGLLKFGTDVEAVEDPTVATVFGELNEGNFITPENARKMFNMNASDPYVNNVDNVDWGISNANSNYGNHFRIDVPTYYKSEFDIKDNKYCAVLGHNFLSGNVAFDLKDLNESVSLITDESSVNNSINSLYYNPPAYNGFSIFKVNSPSYDENGFNKLQFVFSPSTDDVLNKFQIGAISYGTMFEMSISPDLKLNMSYEYGVDEKESRSGSTLSNVKWFQKPNWGSIAPWELDKNGLSTYIDDKENDNTMLHRRSGRRVYDLTFTFMTDDELLATNPNLTADGMLDDSNGNYLTDTDADGNAIQIDELNNRINIHTDHSFYSQVVHKTLGFSIPFIFQPNKDANRPQDFMLAKVDSKKGWKLNQIAPNLFRTKLRIKEVW